MRTVQFTLAIVKTLFLVRRDAYTPKVLTVLLRDTVLYFGSSFAIILANLVIWLAVRVCRLRRLAKRRMAYTSIFLSLQPSLVTVAVG